MAELSVSKDWPHRAANDRGTDAAIQGALFALLAQLATGRRSPATEEDFSRRGILCTPCAGQYGQVAFWLIAVEGSPPLATLVVNVSHSLRPPGKNSHATRMVTFLPCTGGCRGLGAAQERVVWAFVNRFLAEQYMDRATVKAF
jgi:hypothetical protein